MKSKRKTNPETAHEKFLRAQREWDYRIGKNLKLLGTWRFLAIASMSTLLFVIIWAGVYIQKPKLIPYVVEQKNGQINFKGIMKATPITINDAAVRNYLIRFVSHLRSVSTDQVVLRNNLLDLYSISTLAAQREITQYIAKDNPFGKSKQGLRVDLKFTLFQRIDQHTWRVEWTEETRDKGELKSTISWAATLSYTQRTPKSPEEAERNPFGLYFTNFFITKIRS